MARESGGWVKGCLIVGGVIVIVGLVCSGIVSWAGWSIWQNPNVQRAYSVGSAAFDMSREAMTGPGTAELRAAGCTQAMAFTPELIGRFASVVAPDGGAGDLPEVPLVTCIVRHASTTVPSCEEVARVYTAAPGVPFAEVAIQVGIEREQQPRCSGMFGRDGARRRDIDPSVRRTFGQVPPPSP